MLKDRDCTVMYISQGRNLASHSRIPPTHREWRVRAALRGAEGAPSSLRVVREGLQRDGVEVTKMEWWQGAPQVRQG